MTFEEHMGVNCVLHACIETACDHTTVGLQVHRRLCEYVIIFVYVRLYNCLEWYK